MGKVLERPQTPAAKIHSIQIDIIRTVTAAQAHGHRLQEYSLAAAGASENSHMAAAAQRQCQRQLLLTGRIIHHADHRLQCQRILAAGLQIRQIQHIRHAVLPDAAGRRNAVLRRVVRHIRYNGIHLGNRSALLAQKLNLFRFTGC